LVDIRRELKTIFGSATRVWLTVEGVSVQERAGSQFSLGDIDPILVPTQPGRFLSDRAVRVAL
jgi:hypothetical protein